MMKRRVISLLSMIAMLCTMIVFSMPATAVENDTDSPFEAYEELLKDAKSGAEALAAVIDSGDEAQMRLAAQAIKKRIEWVDFQWETEPFPRYAHHEVYELAGYSLDKWSLSKKEDWEAMREVADSVNATLGSEGKDAPDADGKYVDYFVGTEFHLTNDITFPNNVEMKPMGFSIYKQGGGFAGTINGHGYSFKTVCIAVRKSELYVNGDTNGTAYKKSTLQSGLFYRLADCSFIDFGLEGGVVYQNSGDAGSCVSSFGNVISGKKPTFTRVWSSVTLAPICNAQVTALVGSFDDEAITVDVNGFVFDGEILKGAQASHSQQLSYAVYSSSNGDFLANGNNFYNIITDFSARNGNYATSTAKKTYNDNGLVSSALFCFSSEDAFKAATIENVYAVKRKEHGIDAGYAIGSMLSSTASSNALLYDISAAEAAYTINEKNLKGEVPAGVSPVYFKLNDEGKVRPIPEGKSEGKIVKIAVTGDVTKDVFVNPNSSFDLKTALGYKGDILFTDAKGDCAINGTTITVGTGDSSLKMINPCVNHTFEYEGDRDEMQHIGTCSICGHQVTEGCTLVNCKSNSIDWNALTHTGNCEKCDEKYTQNCDYQYTETDDGYKYICSCGGTADAAAPVDAGDANNDGIIDLIDAMYALEKAVELSDTADARNSDVNGNNGVDVNDVRKIILYVIGDRDVKEEFEATAKKVNEGNYYNEENIESGNLKMDGTEGINERYIRTKYISVSEGNKIVFGPVRKAQAVLGHFYDADGNAIELINVNNKRLTNEYTFKAEVQGKDVEVIDYGKDAVIHELKTREVEGLDMVSIIVPEGAAYVRLQANAKEADHFYIRINNEFSLADYQCWTNGDANALKNEENGQLFLTVGDSLCSASRDDQDKTVPKKGWEGRINRDLGAETVDASQGGAALSTVRFINMKNKLEKEGVKPEDDELTTGDGFTLKQSIVNQINMQKDSGRAFEYVLLEGGGNDASMDAKIGYWKNDDPNTGVKLFNPNSYDPKDFAPIDTYMGGLEWAIYSTIKTYGDTAAIGFVLPYPMPLEDRFTDMGNYFMYTQEVCEKWDIPYLDLFYDKLKYLDTEKYTTNGKHTAPDYIHVGGEGYDIMQAYIDPFVRNEMRPANQEIYFKVQSYKDEMDVSWFELEEYKHFFE